MHGGIYVYSYTKIHESSQRPLSGKERSHMLELSAKTNLLEENDYKYSLQDVKEPILYRDVSQL